MRTVRYFFAALALVSALSLPALAGDIHTGVEPRPAPTAAQGEMSTTVNGEMTTGVDADSQILESVG